MKKKIIHITENQLKVIEASMEEVFYYDFFNEVKSYIKELLMDPVNADVTPLFKKHGYSKADVLKKLIDRSIIIRKETVKELPYEVGGDKESKYIVKYAVPRKNFDKKLKRLYLEMFPQQLTEDGATSCGGAMQGGGGNPSAGQYDVPLGTVQRRGFYGPALKRNKDEKNSSISMNRNK